MFIYRQFAHSLAVLSLGAIITGYAIYSCAVYYLQEAEHREMKTTAKYIVSCFEENMNHYGNIDTAENVFKQYLDINARIYNTNYYILDRNTGNILISSEEVYKKYSPEAISTLKKTNKFNIINSKTIVYSLKLPTSLTESGYVQFVSIRSADPLYTSTTRVGTLLAVVLGITIILLAVTLYMTKYHKYVLQNQIIKESEKFIQDTSYKINLPETDDTEIKPVTVIINKLVSIISQDTHKRLEFMSNISHEIKTPLTIIKGFIQGILDGTIPKNETRKYLTRTATQTERLTNLVKTMMKISGIESGEMKLVGKTVNLTALFVETLLMYEKEIEDKNVSVYGVDSEKTIMYGDRDILHQIVYNLVDNAVKFVDEGGKIVLKTYSDENNICIKFGNSGKGIPAMDIPRIFDRFYKTDFSRGIDTSGVGLGLSIVRKFVIFHNGTITLESSDNYTEFTLTFPVYIPEKENSSNEIPVKPDSQQNGE